jgi:hypothetical protein
VDRSRYAHRAEDKFLQNFDWKKLRERDHFEDLGIVGRILLKWILNGILRLCLDSYASG